MRIIIISGMMYPTLSPRAFRTGELAQELARIGHEVKVYIPDNGFDYSAYNSRHNLQVKLFKTRLLKLNPQKKYSFFERLLIRLFKKILAYPYIELVFKVSRILEIEKRADLLITIAFPHTIHWGTALYRRRHKSSFPSVWVSDCGDPYIGNRASWHPGYFAVLEKIWGQQTDYISVPIRNAISAYYPEFRHKIRVIPQGIDMTKIRVSDSLYSSKDGVVHFAYAGLIYPGKRDLEGLLEYLLSFDKPFVFTIFTQSLDYYKNYKSLLGEKLIIKHYIPRDELIYELSRQDFLINLKNPSTVQSPSKLIDYKISNRPILDVSTPFVDRLSFDKAYSGVSFSDYSDFDLTQYDIKVVAKSFIDCYDEMVSKNIQ